MKNSLSILLLVCLFSVNALSAQDEAPVTLDYSLEEQSDTVVLNVSFAVSDDWMVYDSISGEVGPLPVSFEVVDQTNLMLNTIEKPKLKKKYDDIFEVDLWYFTDSVTYSLYYVKIDQQKKYSLSVSTEFMCCNLTSGVCLPPETKLFSTKH